MNPTPSPVTPPPHDVRAILENSPGTQFLRRLTDALGYDFACESLPTRGWPESARACVDGEPRLFATAARGEFHVVYARLACESLSRAAEREVIDAMLGGHTRALFVFSNRGRDLWRFVNVKSEQNRGVLRRITVGARERIRTACERVAMLDVKSVPPSRSAVTASEIRQRHDEAFDARQIARELRRDYERVFRRVEGMIEGFDDDSADRRKARGERARKRLFTLRLFSRMMLTAFVQTKGQLKSDNLFEEAADESDAKITVPGAALDAVVNDLFARYDFTARESTSTDVEVAVDPEMLGKVFEEFVPTRGES